MEQALAVDNFLGVSFGMSRAQLVDILGDPEKWTKSSPIILVYGDVQFSFNEAGEIWLVTVWNVDGRVRVQSNDVQVDWRIDRDRLAALVESVGLTVAPQAGDVVCASGPIFRATAVFEEGVLEKLSLVGVEQASS